VTSQANTVHEAFLQSAQRYADRPLFFLPTSTATLYGTDRREWSYADIARHVAKLADDYQSVEVRTGDRVALMLENRPEFFAHFLALNSLGVSVVPIYHDMPADEVAYRLDHSEAALLVHLPAHRGLAVAAAEISARPIPCSTPSDALPPLLESRRAVTVARDDEAAVVYTSGSTGRPKGCLLSNEYFVDMGRWYIEQGGYCELSPGGERLITPLPVSHMNALTCSFMGMLMSGGCLVQLDRFHPSTWWEQVREAGATVIHYLGVMPAILLKLDPTPEDDFSQQVRFGFGAGVDPRHHALFEERFGFPLIEAWAMTETGSGSCVAASHEPRHVGTRCFGKFPPSMEYRIVDDSGDDCAPYVPGELLVRAAGDNPRRGFFTSYFKDPDATAAAWQGGWFHTGDIVKQDADGSVYFVDRSKNIVRRSGENIAAVEVEGALLALPAVKSCAVAPVPDDIRGEEVMAIVVPADGADRSEAGARALQEASRDALAYFKLPGYIAFANRLPLTSSEKLQRGELKKLCAGLVDSGKVYDLRDLKKRRAAAGDNNKA
jgi:acyl-coenzyme A synthetase/AMP-(fatty) acid ligase